MTSHTELSTLAQCEMKWHLRYREGIVGEPSDSLLLGRMIDAAAAAFWAREDWRAVLAAQIVEQGYTDTTPKLDYLDDVPELEVPARAYWLMQRYERHYSDFREQVTVLGTQVDLTAPIPETSQVHQAILDQVWMVEGTDIWVVERKTYGRNDRSALVEVDPQLTNNLWVARANGIEAIGIIWDGIYTYRWKPERPTQKQLIEDFLASGQGVGWSKRELTEWAREQAEIVPGVERPDRDSFEMLFLDRHEAHVAAAHQEIRALVSRRAALRRGAQPTRNIGPLCKACAQRETCFERLAFPQSIELAS